MFVVGFSVGVNKFAIDKRSQVLLKRFEPNLYVGVCSICHVYGLVPGSSLLTVSRCLLVLPLTNRAFTSSNFPVRQP